MCQLREKEMHETGKWVHALYKLKFIFKKLLKNKIITVKLKKMTMLSLPQQKELFLVQITRKVVFSYSSAKHNHGLLSL